MVNGIVELLPREAFQVSSAENIRLNSYGATFSHRPDRPWYQPLRLVMAILGSGYLYSWAARTVETLANGRSLSILDAACGDGFLRRYLSSRHNYVGIDFSSRLLVRAQRYYPSTYFRADLNHPPFPDATFDAVISLQALQYVDRPEVALEQAARILKPGGALLLTVPNCGSFKYRRQGVPQIQLQEFDRESVTSLLSRHFEVLILDARGIWVPLPKIHVHAPGAYPGHWGLSWTVLAASRK
jgi:SAM-dependent methyltransferase